MRVFLDAGHGGNNPGCTYGNFHEKDYTLSFAMQLGSALVDAGHLVRYSRIIDENPPFAQRAWRCDGQKPPMHLALVLHVNANPDPKIGGLRCYVTAPNTQAYDRASTILAKAPNRLKIQGKGGKALTRKPEITSKDHQGDDVVIGRYVTPAVLIEVGFASNPDEQAYLLSDAGRSEIIAGIVEALHV